MKFRDLGFSREQLMKLGEVYDVLGVPKSMQVFVDDEELSWSRMFELEKISDVKLASDDDSPSSSDGPLLHLSPTPEGKALAQEHIKAIEDSVKSYREAEEMEDYLDYVEAGSIYFDEVIAEERVRQNILLDTIAVEDAIVRMDLTCCNSANPGSNTIRDSSGAEKTCKFFDNENHLFLQSVILASVSLFLDLNDTGERSSEQGVLVEKLVQEGFARAQIKQALLQSLGLQDRSIKSAGAKQAVIRVYSGSILRRDTSIIEHETGKREHTVQGWNMHELCISREAALVILHAYFVDHDNGLIALVLACALDDDQPTFNRLFIDLCAIWLVDHARKNTPGPCSKGQCFACEDTPLCYGELFPISTLSEGLRSRFDYRDALMVDLLLSQAAASLTFPSQVRNVRDQLRILFRAQRDQNAQSSSVDEVTVNTGLTKIGVVLLTGDELDLELLTIVSPQGAEVVRRKHALDKKVFKNSYIMEALSEFCDEEYVLEEVVIYTEVEATFGSVPAKSDEMKRFVRQASPAPVGRWGSFRRLWQEGMYHLSLSPVGMQVSRFPHREGGVTIWQFAVEAGAQTGNVDLRNLRKLAQGGFGPAIIEDVIEHHELGNIQIPSSGYSCYARDRTNRGEPVVQALRPVNLRNSKRFATDGRKLWYNVCGEEYVRCTRKRGQWTFLYSEKCKKESKSKLIHIQPKKRIIISARWAH